MSTGKAPQSHSTSDCPISGIAENRLVNNGLHPRILFLAPLGELFPRKAVAICEDTRMVPTFQGFNKAVGAVIDSSTGCEGRYGQKITRRR